MLSFFISCSITFVGLVALALSIISLPGSWLLVVIAGLMTFAADRSKMYAMDETTFWIVLAIAVVGEVIEFAAGAAGVNKLGGSKRSAALAVVGSIIGAIVGMFVGTPVPVIGSVVVSLLLGGVGAFAGASLGERWAGREWTDAMQIGKAAFWGRLLGTFGKIVCSTTIMSVVTGAAWISK
jgi:uncharacterized protein